MLIFFKIPLRSEVQIELKYFKANFERFFPGTLSPAYSRVRGLGPNQILQKKQIRGRPYL